MGIGTVVWDNGKVTIEAVGVQGEPVIRVEPRGGLLA